ncbi:MAG: hypothetical protein HUK26_02435, partial [Duodenibacillus sp.]|nr:hypothetical protein [Duodenibacillus sp.]
GLQKYETLEIFPADQTVMNLRVYQGRKKRLPLAAPDGVYASVERERLVSKGMSAFSIRFEYMGPVVAPVRKGDRIGVLNVLFDGEKTGSSPLHAQRDVVSGSFAGQLIDAVRMRVSPPKNIYE